MAESLPAKSVDWKYILTHYNEGDYEIPHFYDMQTWTSNDTHHVRISSIFDATKFWMVFRYDELDIFQSLLNDFYKKHGSSYKLSELTDENLRRGIYCVVISDGAYYRAIVAEVPFPTSIKGYKVTTFLIDFGYMATVNEAEVYYLAEKFYTVPRFAVRSVLTGIEPITGDTWPKDCTKRFHELVTGKILLCCVLDTHKKKKTLYVCLAELGQMFISDMLIGERLASVVNRNSVKKESTVTPVTKFPYLFPSFEAVETFGLPFPLYSSDVLKDYQNLMYCQMGDTKIT